MLKIVTAPVLLLTCAYLQAATIHKCEGPDGGIIFTQQACPDGSSGKTLNVTNNRPSGKGETIPWGVASPAPLESEPATNKGSSLTIVGDAENGCSTASEQEIRTAIVQQKVFPGMTSEQAEKAWGRPTKINASSHGNDQWVYYRDDYSAQYIYVDSNGCVTAWN